MSALRQFCGMTKIAVDPTILRALRNSGVGISAAPSNMGGIGRYVPPNNLAVSARGARPDTRPGVGPAAAGGKVIGGKISPSGMGGSQTKQPDSLLWHSAPNPPQNLVKAMPNPPQNLVKAMPNPPQNLVKAMPNPPQNLVKAMPNPSSNSSQPNTMGRNIGYGLGRMMSPISSFYNRYMNDDFK